MSAALLLVVSPLLHPIAARAGEYLAWYPTQDVVVMARRGTGWRVVRRLGCDNAGAIASLLADGALTLAYARGALPVPPEMPERSGMAPTYHQRLALIR